jgi:molecular chaperone HscA
MGRGLADIAGRDKLPYRVCRPRQPAWWALHTAQGEKSPVEVSAEILATLR